MRAARFALLLAACSANSPSVHACANEYEPTFNQTPAASMGIPPFPGEIPDSSAWIRRTLAFERLGAREFRERSDYAASLLRTGRAEEAKQILVALETERPGEYNVAANLGTAYELTGEIDSAAVWIAEGMRRNPASHEGTEWLHLAILETKRSMAFGDGFTGGIATGKRTPTETRKALEYQLRERMYFVKPPDPIVGDLLLELAQRTQEDGEDSHARGVLELSLRYGGPRDALARQLLASPPTSAARPLLRGKVVRDVAIIAVVVGMVVLWLIRMRRLT